MMKLQHAFKWCDNLLAALDFFTRLPFRQLRRPPRSSYAAVVEWWPLTGWLTAAAMAATLWGCSMVFPYPVAVLTAVAARLLTTGAMHEKGLADFFDGLGRVGSVALVLYFGLLAATLLSLPHAVAPLAVIAADPFSKMVASQLVLMMPPAHADGPRVGWRKPSVTAGISLTVQGLLPLAVFAYLTRGATDWSLLVFPACLTMYFLYRLVWNRLHGYTVACCGAVCLLVELAFYLALCAQLHGVQQ